MPPRRTLTGPDRAQRCQSSHQANPGGDHGEFPVFVLFSLSESKSHQKELSMASPAQIEANRRNALRSTGPRTPRGKQQSRLNAVRHGLTAQTVLLPGDDPSAYEALRADIHSRLRPEGVLEVILVERITSLLWRMRRLGEIEIGLFEGCRSTVPRSISRVADPAEPTSSEFGLGFWRRANAFSTLVRYESSLDRAIYRALQELRRLQEARQTISVAPAEDRVIDLPTEPELQNEANDPG